MSKEDDKLNSIDLDAELLQHDFKKIYTPTKFPTRAEIHNNTRIMAESTVKSQKNTEQIMKTNEVLVKQLQGLDSSLNNLTNEFITHSKDSHLLEIDQSDKLDQMIQLLKNPSDKSLIDGFKDMPAQLTIGLTLQALIKYFGMG